MKLFLKVLQFGTLVFLADILFGTIGKNLPVVEQIRSGFKFTRNG